MTPVGGSGYWRGSSGAEDQPAETESASESPAGTRGRWLDIESQSDEALIQFLGLDRTDRVPQSRSGQAEATHDRLPSESAEAIERFEPRQANLPDLAREGAADHIRDNADRRPWLKPAERSPADVQHVLAAVDQGGGHALERHEGYTTGERLERRVGGLEDPAQLDPELQAKGRDARKPDKLHACEPTATSINDPRAFAAAFARGTEHPNMQATLGRPREPYETRPDEVEVPISELLGEDGHQLCAGFRLLPIDGDMDAAKRNRRQWADAPPEQRQHMNMPQTEPILADEFRGGTIVFTFRKTDDHSHWEVAPMFPKPRDRNEQQP